MHDTQAPYSDCISYTGLCCFAICQVPRRCWTSIYPHVCSCLGRRCMVHRRSTERPAHAVSCKNAAPMRVLANSQEAAEIDYQKKHGGGGNMGKPAGGPPAMSTEAPPVQKI